MRERWGRVATLMWVLSFTTILSWWIPVLMIPGGVLAAESLRRVGVLLGERAGRRYFEWASVAAGGVVASAVLMLPEQGRDLARLANFGALSLAISLYALGLAVFAAPADGGKVSRSLRRSVAVWWGALGLYLVAYATAGDDRRSGWFLFYDGRVVDDRWMVPVLGGLVAAFWMLARNLYVIRMSLRSLADEPTDELVESS